MTAKSAPLSYLIWAAWQLVFALSFAFQHLGGAQLLDSLGRDRRKAAQYLAETGGQFAASILTSDGRLVRIGAEPICEANLATRAALAYGGVQDGAAHLRNAFAGAEGAAAPHLTHDLELLSQALAGLSESIEEIQGRGTGCAPRSSAGGSELTNQRVLPMREEPKPLVGEPMEALLGW